MGQFIANRYQIVSEIGAGGMGTVYRAHDVQTGQTVAIKSLKPELAQPDLIERFKREGQALRDLNHPNIVKLLDTVEDRYLVMEYVSGGDLNDLIRQGKPDLQTILRLSLDLADALTRAHKLGIMHRDLKPANMLISDDGTLRLTDFGVASYAGKPAVTDPDAIIGTLDYLPPEAFSGETLDTRADLWAFGVVLYEMITGMRPFTGSSVMETINKITTAPFPDLETLCPDVPITLIDLIYRMLARDREARIASARHVGAALEDIQHGRGYQTRFDTPLEQFVLIKSNLPLQVTPFIGRETELRELHHLFDRPDVRLVTVLAPGGMGKTRLALEFAGQMNFADGVFFVDLAPLDKPENIVLAVAEAVDYQLTSGDARQQILHYLRDKSMLLVMDNFEHLLEGAVLIQALIQSAPELRVIVTSRERLKLNAEHLLNLAGLDDSEAVSLFIQSARRINSHFEAPESDIIRICHLVEGLPLGIVLAASWTEMLSLHEIAVEISRSVDFLDSEMRDLPQRHRSIRAVFDYSWKLLNETERDTLSRLSVFRGGFTREAAEAITGASLRPLMNLVNKSLLRRDPESGRYTLHELLRQYAETRLAPDSTVRHDHSVYFLKFAYEQGRIIRGFGQPNMQQIALRLLETDYGNIRAAWDTAIQEQNVEAIGEAAWMWMFYETLGWYEEAKILYESALHTLPDPDSLAAAQLCTGLIAFIAGLVGPKGYDIAEGYALRAIGIYRQHSVLEKDVVPLIDLGIMTAARGDLEGAKRINQEVITLAEKGGDIVGRYVAIGNLGGIAAHEKKYEEARQFMETRLVLARQRGDLWSVSECISNLSGVMYHLGDYTDSLRLALEGLTIAHSIKQKRVVEQVLGWLAFLTFEGQDFNSCVNYAKQVLNMTQNTSHIINAKILLSLAAVRKNDDESAQRYYKEVLDYDIPETFPVLLVIKSRLFVLQGDIETAVEHVALLSKDETKLWDKYLPELHRLRDKLQAELSPDLYQAAWERGQQRDFDKVIAELKAEFG